MPTRKLYIMLTALAVISAIGCNRKTGMKAQLAEADRIIDTAADSALAILEGINIDAGDDGDKAMYNLLLTQARYANYIPVTSDSLINTCIQQMSRLELGLLRNRAKSDNFAGKSKDNDNAQRLPDKKHNILTRHETLQPLP